MSDSRAQDLLRIGSAAFSRLTGYFSLCQTLAELYYPLRADWTTDFTLGTDFATDVMDGFTINARETLGNAIDSMLRQGDWFEISTGDEARDKRAVNAIALSRATNMYRRIIRDPRSRFQVATKEADHDWVTFGNPVLSWEETPTRDHLFLRAWHPKHCAWLVDETGEVNWMFRRFNLEARNIEKRFKTKQWRGTLHRDVEAAAKNDPSHSFPIMHVLLPKDEIYGWSRKDSLKTKHDFISLYIDETHNEILNELGAPVFNYVVPRARTVSTFNRGFSPMAINSLPDARMLQQMASVILEQGEKAVDPPIVGSQNIFKNDINLFAGGFTTVDMGDNDDIRKLMQVVNTTEGLSAGVQLKQDVRALLAEGWLLNKLFLPNVREMRELEVMVRTEEFRRAALPFFTPIESEYNAPVLSVGFQMAVHMGMIPADMFPAELQGAEVSWTFQSPLKEAEGQKVVAAFNTSVQIIAAGSQAEPGLAKQFDIAEAAIDAVIGAGAKPEWIKPEKERQKQRAQDQQVQEISETAALLQQGAGAAQDVAGAKVAVEQAGLV